MQGRISNDKYEAEIERTLKKMISEQDVKVTAEYDLIIRDLKEALRGYYVQNEGQVFSKAKREEIRNIIQRTVNNHHRQIRDEVKRTSNSAAIIGFSGVQYQTEKKDKVKVPLAAMALSALHKGYKKSRVHRKYTAKELQDGKNYADRVRRNHGQLVIELTGKIGHGVTEEEGWIKLDKAIEKSVKKIERNTKNIQKVEAERVKEEAAKDSVKELKKVGIIKVKTWETREDDRVRRSHEELHGKTIEENQLFETNGGRAEGPGQFGVAEEDINCRCRLHWDTVEIDEDEIESLEDATTDADEAYQEWKEKNGYWY